MGHYVLQLKRPRDTFAVYSTIVDNLITAPMTSEAMRSWLEEREYTSWLKKGGDTLDELIEKYGEETGRSIHDMQAFASEWFYWHEGMGFTFAKESDAYFCLPRRYWRHD